MWLTIRVNFFRVAGMKLQLSLFVLACLILTSPARAQGVSDRPPHGGSVEGAEAAAAARPRIDRHVVVFIKESKATTMVNLIDRSIVQLEAEFRNEKVSLTACDLKDAIANLKSADLTYGTAVEATIAAVRAENPRLKLMIPRFESDRPELPWIQAYLLPAGHAANESLTEVRLPATELSKLREDVQNAYVLVEALARNAKPSEAVHARRFAEILLRSPAPTAEQLRELLRQFRKIPSTQAATH